jgi:hypothetical protein
MQIDFVAVLLTLDTFSLLLEDILYDPGPIDVWGRILSSLLTLEEKNTEFFDFLVGIFAVVGLYDYKGVGCYLDYI